MGCGGSEGFEGLGFGRLPVAGGAQALPQAPLTLNLRLESKTEEEQGLRFESLWFGDSWECEGMVSGREGLPVAGGAQALDQLLSPSPRLHALNPKQGYLAHKKSPHRRTLQYDHASGLMVVLGGGAFSYDGRRWDLAPRQE